MTSLAQLDRGQSAKVIQIGSQGDVGRRLLEMGITPGVEIRLIGSAPLGDPLEFELRGYRLCLRRNEAAQVDIELESPTT